MYSMRTAPPKRNSVRGNASCSTETTGAFAYDDQPKLNVNMFTT